MSAINNRPETRWHVPSAPERTSLVLSRALRNTDPGLAGRILTDRLLGVVASQGPDARVTLTLGTERDGEVRVSVDAVGVTPTFPQDLAWCSEGVHEWEEVVPDAGRPAPRVLREVVAAVTRQSPRLTPEPVVPGAPDDTGARTLTRLLPGADQDAFRRPLGTWPNTVMTNSALTMTRVLRSAGATLRVHLAPAGSAETWMLQETVLATEGRASTETVMGYVGVPVRMRLLLGTDLDEEIPARVVVALEDWASDLEVVPLGVDEDAKEVWAGASRTLQGRAVPRGMARGLVRIPVPGERTGVIGIRCAMPTTPEVPLTDAVPTEGLRLGTALDSTGGRTEVRIGLEQLCQHVHVLGASGAGKSTLQAGVVAWAVEHGLGVTVIDPHGTLVSRCVDELPDGAAARTHLVRTADLERPTPLNPFAGRDFETMVGEVIEILYAVFDPKHTGIIGPRFERIFHQAMGAASALFGDRATISLVPELLADRERITDVACAVHHINPRLARELESELAGNHSSEFADMLAWVNSKFDRVLRSSAMRAVFGSGREAIDVQGVMDRGEVLLIDLAAPRIGQDQAAFIGMIWVMEHALAMASRVQRHRPHLLVIDEAQLFQVGGLPELLAEGRKFGISVLLAHQHMGQLSAELASSLEANASTVMGMRSSIQDAPRVAARIGTWSGGSLSRLPNMHAATTLATPAGQTQAFTLVVDHNERADALRRERPGAVERNRQITRSRVLRRCQELGSLKALTSDDVEAAICQCEANDLVRLTASPHLEPCEQDGGVLRPQDGPQDDDFGSLLEECLTSLGMGEPVSGSADIDTLLSGSED